MRIKIIRLLSGLMPDSLRSFLRKLGLNEGLNKMIDKSEGEIIFQSAWVGKFKDNKDKVLKYWQDYLYLNKIKKTCQFTPQTKVLDVGCGISSVLHFIKGERYGIDPLADEYLKMYDYPQGISIQKGVGEKLPFRDGFFDVAFCTNVLDHTDDPMAVVGEISRVLKKGGYFILAIHIFNSNFKRDPAHPHTFTREDVYSLIGGRFKPVFQKVSSAVGFYDYVLKGVRKSKNMELVLILKML